MKNRLILITTILIIGFASNAQSYSVIVNESNPITSLTRSEISKIFLKKTNKWKDGSMIIPVDLSSGSVVRAKFSEQILGKPVFALKSYWQQYVFAGNGTPPAEKINDADVINFVRTQPGAIGYISSSTKATGVKTVIIK